MKFWWYSDLSYVFVVVVDVLFNYIMNFFFYILSHYFMIYYIHINVNIFNYYSIIIGGFAHFYSIQFLSKFILLTYILSFLIICKNIKEKSTSHILTNILIKYKQPILPKLTNKLLYLPLTESEITDFTGDCIEWLTKYFKKFDFFNKY